ncbi:MAG: hypothetical protein HC897_00710 [Thermoanaerobaculia bacterium]|nr:hypothetical protein [Thermoanaerobaculia bacterium]
MLEAKVVRATMISDRRIELVEPMPGIRGPVEVTLRPVAVEPQVPDVFDLIASLPPGKRSKTKIDRDLAEERASWGDR